MRRKKVFIAIVILLVLGFAGYHRVIDDIEFEVPGWIGGGQREPFYAISSHFILYHSTNNRLTVYDIQKETQTKIDSDMNFRNRRPSICDPWVIWLDGRSERYIVAGYDLRCGQYVSIDLDNIYKPGNPQIDGSTLVWTEGFDLNGYDLQTRTKIVACADMVSREGRSMSNVGRVSSADTSNVIPDIEGGIVVWKGLRGTDGIEGYDLKTQRRFSIPATPSSNSPPKVSGRYVVWKETERIQGKRRDSSILAYDLESGERTTVCAGVDHSYDIDINGDIVVWSDIGDNGSSDIFGYNLTTHQQFPICTAEGNQCTPRISGNTVIWSDFRSQGWLAKLLKKEPSIIRGKIFRHWPGEVE
jgi:beta propeller repeat protein